MTAHVEQLEFQAEARQLLDLMVHSVYSNKDSFLRELISNASDALDKLRLEALRNKDLDVDTSDLHIEIEVDEDARTLTVRDNGIGMSRDEVVDLIGTLAKSGTAELRQQAAGGQERRRLRGTDRPVRHRLLLDLHGRRQGQAAHPQGRRKRGHPLGVERRGHLHHRIRRRRPAGHLRHAAPQARGRRGPAARLHRRSGRSGSSSRSTPTSSPGRSGWRSSDGPRPPRRAARTTVTVETETLNSMKALWARPRTRSPTRSTRSSTSTSPRLGRSARGHPDEGRGHLRVPGAAVHSVARAVRPVHARAKTGVQLYVKRVFIMDDCEQLMPEYLRFVKGVVDAQDLSLNVSREILQQDRQITAIRRRLTKKVLSTIKDLQSRAARGLPDVLERSSAGCSRKA